MSEIGQGVKPRTLKIISAPFKNGDNMAYGYKKGRRTGRKPRKVVYY